MVGSVAIRRTLNILVSRRNINRTLQALTADSALRRTPSQYKTDAYLFQRSSAAVRLVQHRKSHKQDEFRDLVCRALQSSDMPSFGPGTGEVSLVKATSNRSPCSAVLMWRDRPSSMYTLQMRMPQPRASRQYHFLQVSKSSCFIAQAFLRFVILTEYFRKEFRLKHSFSINLYSGQD